MVRMTAGEVRANHAANSSALDSVGWGRRAMRMRTGDSLVTVVLRWSEGCGWDVLRAGMLVVCWVFVVGAALMVIEDPLEDVGKFEC